MLLTVASLITRQHSSYLDALFMAPFDFICTFDVEQIVLDAQRQAAHMIGESIKEMILKTSIDHLSLLKGKINDLFRAIMKTDIDPSPLKSLLHFASLCFSHLLDLS